MPRRAIVVAAKDAGRARTGPRLRVWLPEEDRIVDRHARALAAGRHKFQRDAHAACSEELARRFPERWPEPRLPLKPVVRKRLKKRMADLGLTWLSVLATKQEERLVERYARMLVAGRFRRTIHAARACQAQIERLPSFRIRPVPFKTTRMRIYNSAQRMGLWPNSLWSPEEQRIVDRYARAVADGRYPDAVRAATVCRLELQKRLGPAGLSPLAGRTVESVTKQILHRDYARGHRAHYLAWNPAELRVLNRHLAGLYEGRYSETGQAAEACARELGTADLGTGKRGRHRAGAFKSAMIKAITEFRLPRHKGMQVPWEKAIVKRYARAMKDGAFDSYLAAACACRSELRRRWDEAFRSSPLPVRKPAGRSLRAINNSIQDAAREMGLFFSPPWSDAELRVVRSWLPWYERSGPNRRYKQLKETALGVQDDLAKLGFTRGLHACSARVTLERRRRHGVA